MTTHPTPDNWAKLTEIRVAFANANPLIRMQTGHVVMPLLELLGNVLQELQRLKETPRHGN